MERGGVIAKLIDSKKAAILGVILNSKEELYLKEVSDKSNVSITSTFRILKELIELDIINKKEWKTSKVYYCQKNGKVDFLKELFIQTYDGLSDFVKEVVEMEGVENIVLHGTKKKNKANVLVIGNSVDADKIDIICEQIKNKGFEITFMPLTKEQYTQMVKMGLYSGEKKVLK
ncbi:hypothetical protein HOE37_04875 [Candidatus Woesearchaeota archaeon]|jgi:predicted transcriptional regulator|nr:hypothetical protein [Candidatus Woesearchaeota archaeon]MBT4111166.1 hypothetical protein [Candidatus Woesearchaeota archaeon]MBT4336747.1 hypothetical protein [Candidatus Woesearchaeota archaeon]MBT4469415.1 hypothetical protein [Candidatus Woesearchaeota archaeon]MBT6744190.1 hypothetical protein [Candidatus Woesearchaeota archaeon]